MIFRFDCEKGLEFHTLHHARHGHVSVLVMYSRCFSERALVYQLKRILTSDARAAPPLLSGTMINSSTPTSASSTA